ncbi:hypothetical protein [Pontixanthobacter luteolus]|uniref:hypothetical protein n=1 Tax=Pontixanthobacter luteolus TaxID=295089 RepID=UPI002302C4C0|nr:hypothetical protein [Pontixanthobacter luteolus]
MNKALHEKTAAKERGASTRDWRKGMSDNVAWALIVYTALHIFATVGAMKETGMKSLALLALVVLVAGIIPACRRFERRWRDLTDEEAASPRFADAYRRDQIALWILAIGLPFALTALFKGIAAMA